MFRSKAGSDGYETTIGLWKTCSSDTLLKVCAPIACPLENDSLGFCNKLTAARAFITLACIISFISALCLFASAAIDDDKKRIVLMGAKGLAFACLIIAIIGVAIGINGTTQTGTSVKLDLGAAAIIGIIALVINLGGAIVSVLIK